MAGGVRGRGRRGRLVAALLVVGGVLAVVAAAQDTWTAPPEARALRNPVSGVGDAPKLVEVNCVSCHGERGKGDGPAAPALPTKPADWTSPRVQNQTDGELFWKITQGRGVMPSWKHLPETARWQLVNYIRTLKP